MTNEVFTVRENTPRRLYTKVYNDFLRSPILTANERLVYIALKAFVSYGQDEGEIFPSLDTLREYTALSPKTIIKTINGLIEKGAVKKKRQGLTKPNIYTLYDSPDMWVAESAEDMREISEEVIHGSTEQLIKELERRGLEVTVTKKEPVSAAVQSTETGVNEINCNIWYDGDNPPKSNTRVEEIHCQEFLTIEDVKSLYDYDVLASKDGVDVDDADMVMDVLYDALTTSKPTIRVGGEDRPTSVVVSKLRKLTYAEILYAIDQFNSSNTDIKNHRAYLLTILYGAREQMRLDYNNQVQRNLYGGSESPP